MVFEVSGNDLRACHGPGCTNRFEAVYRPGRVREFCSAKCRQAAFKERKRKRSKRVPEPVNPISGNVIDAFGKWCGDVLRIPPGHPNSGKAMEFPEFLMDFFHDVMDPKIFEMLLCIGRKNAKSAAVAVLILFFLIGPLASPGWRAGVASVSKSKSRELKDQVEDIAAASGLTDRLTFKKSPYPGSIESECGKVEILSAEGGGGHSSGFDLSIIDEIGLLAERDRELVNSMRAATSAKNGKFISLSIFGDGPFVPEILAMRHEPGVSVHLFQAPEDCRLDDEAAWRAANPGLGTIKSVPYMRRASRRAMLTPADEAHFRAMDLNRPGSPTKAMLCSPSDWSACRVETLPPRTGPCFVGIDLGSNQSMTALMALWPQSGRMEAWGGLPGIPAIEDRQRRDMTRYDLMVQSGELTVYPGVRVTPVEKFLKSCAKALKGERIASLGADRFRQSELRQFIEESGLPWASKLVWRGTGASKTADGSHDVRAFQRMVMSREIRHGGGLLLASAIANSALRYDSAGNPALDRSGPGRIDPLQAAVIAAGLSQLQGKKGRSSWRYGGRV